MSVYGLTQNILVILFAMKALQTIDFIWVKKTEVYKTSRQTNI